MDCCCGGGGGVDILVRGCILLCGCEGDFYGINNVSSILLSRLCGLSFGYLTQCFIVVWYVLSHAKSAFMSCLHSLEGPKRLSVGLVVMSESWWHHIRLQIILLADIRRIFLIYKHSLGKGEAWYLYKVIFGGVISSKSILSSCAMEVWKLGRSSQTFLFLCH